MRGVIGMRSFSRLIKSFSVSFVSLLIVFVLVSNNAYAATYKTLSLTYEVDQSEARSMLSSINDWRQSGDAWYWEEGDTTKHMCGKLNAYTYDYTLEQIALQRAYEIAVHFDHTRPDGNTCWTCTYNGIQSYGENIAVAARTADEAFELWQENSYGYDRQGHRRAMLSSSYKAIGIGHVVYNGVHFWVQEFGISNSGAAATTAVVGTKTATVKIDVSLFTFRLNTDDRITSISYGTTQTLPKVVGQYYSSETWGTCGAFVPDSELSNIKWTSGDTSKLVIQNNSTVKAVGTGSCTLTYSATYGGKSYSGTMNVNVSTVSLANSAITATVPTCSYEVNGVTPKPVITYNGYTLVEGTDYEITSYGSNTYVTSNAYVYVKGIGNFTGKKYIYFEITKSKLSDCVLEAIPDVNYTGSAITPSITLSYKGAALKKGTHYTMSCTDNTNPGTATVTITGATGFDGTLTASYKILTQSASNLTFNAIADQQYNGTEITPSLTIKNGTKYLAKDTDYSVVFSDNIEPGTATAVVTFIGNYTGTKTVNFNIIPRNVSNVSVSGVYSRTYTGSPITQNITVYTGSTTLVEGVDYTVKYANNTDIGTATITLTGIGDHFTGTRDITFSITAVTASMTSFKTSGSYVYTGSAIIPEFTLTYGDLTFIEGTDYTATLSDNVEPGQAKVVITGISTRLTGTANKYFTINRKGISALTVEDVPDQVYTGSAIEPSIVIKDGNKTLISETDFTVTYYNNTNINSRAYAYVSGTGHYSGSLYVYFNIVGKPINSATIGTISDQTYTGSAIRPSVTVKLNGTTLTSGTDYTVSYSNNTNVGKATLTVTGKGTYSGSVSTTFNIVARSLSEATISRISSQAYTGKALTPSVTVTDGSKTLIKDRDYTVAYTDNTEVGTATVIVTGTGNYKDSITATFTIYARSLSNASINSILAQTFTGSEIKPAVTVTYYSTTLTEGVDYRLTYSNNINAGTATVTVTGIGLYTDSRSVTFKINKKSISDAVISPIADQAYTGSAIKPALTVTDGSRNLVLDTDYTASYSNCVNAGTAKVTISGIGNYSGTLTATYSIVSMTSKFTIEAVGAQTYTGSPLTPAVTAKDGDKILTSGTDYTAEYFNNVNVGTAMVTVTGKGSYSGSISTTFAILPRSISNAAISSIAAHTYTGSAITPAPVVTDGTRTLKLDVDYTVSYSRNTDVGTATVTIYGTGNYTGSNGATFIINARSINSVTIASIPSQSYTGSAITPAITVTDGDNKLIKDTDYTVSYKDNTDVGEATVTIKGIGNYTGTTTATFNIVSNPSRLTIDPIDDQTFNKSYLKPDVTVRAGSKVLSADTDYVVSYSDNYAAGTAKVTVTGKGDYQGTVTAYFTILPKSVKGLTVSDIIDYTYSVTAAEPSVTVKDGGVLLNNPKDYMISYLNNVNAGKATLRVTGNGNYTGTLDKTFTIMPRSISVSSISTIDSQMYTGDPIEPKIKLIVNSVTLVESRDYELTYADNVDVGTATVTVTGINNYKDSKTVSFKIIGDTGFTGWVTDAKGKKYYYENGAMVLGFKTIEGKRYYFSKKSGKMLTGWRELAGKKYYFNPKTGAATVNGKKIDGKYYLFSAKGVMQKSGWKNDSKGNTYYLKKSGVAYTKKWAKKKGKWYYFGFNGKMVKGTSLKIGKKTYKFKSNGICKNP